jgi:hypothetical protein
LKRCVITRFSNARPKQAADKRLVCLLCLQNGNAFSCEIEMKKAVGLGAGSVAHPQGNKRIQWVIETTLLLALFFSAECISA